MRQSSLAAWLARPPVAEVDHPISATRAYIEVLGVYGAFFAVGATQALLLLADVAPPPGKTTWATAVPGIIATLVEAGVAVTLAVVLCERRHRTASDLGLSPRLSASPSISGISCREAWIGAVGLAVLGQLLFGEVNDLIGSSGYPFGTHNAAYLTEQLARSLNAGIVEETVVLAFVMVTLAQAKRPLWEIVAIAVVLRGLFHVYYGPGALGVLPWVPVSMWVFWRGRSLFPLIVVHTIWDANGFLRWYKIPSAIPTGVVVTLGVVSFLTLGLLMWHPAAWGLPIEWSGGRLIRSPAAKDATTGR